MKATLITSFRNASADGSLVEIVPAPVSPSKHLYKYRLAYVVGGTRVVGFDNERGKGDHCHVGAVERTYRFTTVSRLIDDYLLEVQKWNRAP